MVLESNNSGSGERGVKSTRHSERAAKMSKKDACEHRESNGTKDRKKKRRKRNESKDQRHVNIRDEESQADTTGTSKSTLSSSFSDTRDALRESVMTEVLKDYYDKPNATQVEVIPEPRRWPLFQIRKFLGLAHVGLHDAVIDGDIKIVNATLLRYIRKCPAKINEHDAEGRTALSLALKTQREDIADIIISVGETNVNNPDKGTALSPLHTAVLLDLQSSAQKLAFRGADVNAVDKVGMTPLMLACRLGNKSMVDILTDLFGAELDLQDKVGWTGLFYATSRNEATIVEKLLAGGSNPEHKDMQGMMALDWGEHLGFGETCSVFERFESRLVP